MAHTPSDTIAAYRIQADLGPAPYGHAYRAVDTRSDLEVILKVIPRPTAGTSFIEPGAEWLWQERLSETRRLSRLDNTGIPTVYEVGETDESLLIALAPTRGKTLREFVAEGGRVSRETLVDWGCQLLSLLAEAHAQDVLHRHLSADAVVLGDGGDLVLTGFAMTQLAPEAPELQSPEQRRGAQLTTRSDLYSLAALLRRLAAPASLGGGSEHGLMADDPLLAVLRRGCAEEPERRFRDAAEMEEAIRAAADPAARALAGPASAPSLATQALPRQEPEAASTPAAGAQARRAAGAAVAAPRRRSRLPFAAAVLVLLVLAGLGAVWMDRQGMVDLPWLRSLPGMDAVFGPPPATREAPAAGARSPVAAEAGLHGPAQAVDTASAQEVEALRLARGLVESGAVTLFGETSLDPQGEELLADLETDVAGLGFEDDPLGQRPAHSLFGENPLLSGDNPIIDEELRQRWLAVAINHVGTDEAMAHLTEQAEKLQAGEVSLAQWYRHVAQCKDFCSKVVSGLLYEHVRRVSELPHSLLLFASNTSALEAASRDRLEEFVAGQSSEVHYLLIGRASRSGNRLYNRTLSQRRVNAVERELADLGVGQDHLNGFWLGYEPPQLSREIGDLYSLPPELPEETLNQSVLVVAYTLRTLPENEG